MSPRKQMWTMLVPIIHQIMMSGQMAFVNKSVKKIKSVRVVLDKLPHLAVVPYWIQRQPIVKRMRVAVPSFIILQTRLRLVHKHHPSPVPIWHKCVPIQANVPLVLLNVRKRHVVMPRPRPTLVTVSIQGSSVTTFHLATFSMDYKSIIRERKRRERTIPLICNDKNGANCLVVL